MLGMDFIYFAAKHASSNNLKGPDALLIGSRIISAVGWANIAQSAMGTLVFDTKKTLFSQLSIGGHPVGFSVKDLLADCFAGLLCTSPDHASEETSQLSM